MECFAEFIILVVLLYWIFTSRVNTMIDMVTNKVFDAYSRFNPNDQDRNKDVLLTIGKLKRFGDEAKQRKAFQREMDREIRDKYLFDIKENHSEVLNSNQRPLTGLSCDNCCPTSRQSLVNRTIQQLSLVNLFNQELPVNQNGYLNKLFGDLIKVHSVKKFDYPRVEGTVLQDERLKKAIEKTAIEQFHDIDSNDESYYRKLIKTNEKRAYKLLYDMRSTLSDFLLRFTSWVLYKLLPLFLNSVIVHPGQIEMLNKASESGLPMIFIPLHRSHLDYIMVSFILLNRDIRSPLVAAGDNLRIPFFGSLLRGLGAFYIKRRIDPIMGRKDHVYKAVLHTYMNECLRAGHNIEFFLEGGRTRTGKPCMPKYGIFSVIVDAFMDGTIEDALLVPISMNYEKLIDGNFVREQLGEPKEMETFGLALKSIWKILNSNYGMMRIDFNQPFSLRELVKTFNTSGKVPPANGLKENKKLRSRPSTTSLYGTDVVAEEQKQLVQSISKHVLFDCVASTAIMSTNALAFLLLNKFRNGATITELALALDDLRDDILQAKKDLGFSGDSVDVIHYAAELLGPGLVRIDLTEIEEIVRPVCILPNVIELSYYSNCLMQHFILKSIIATALSAMDFSSDYVNAEELMQNCFDLCEILQFEFIFCKPCQNKETAILNVIDEFILRDHIFFQNNNSMDSLRNRRLAEELLNEVVGEKLPEYQINKNENCIKQLKFFRDLLLPWIEPYSYTAKALEKLIGETSLEGDLIKNVLADMKQQFADGNVLYGESICADPIKNALKLFQHWETIECHSEGRVRLIYLRDQYDNSESVKSILNRINKYKTTTF